MTGRKNIKTNTLVQKDDPMLMHKGYHEIYHYLFKPKVKQYLLREDMAELAKEQKIENVMEQTVFEKHKDEFKRLSSINFSRVYFAIIQELFSISPKGMYPIGIPVQFVARCRIISLPTETDMPLAIVSDMYGQKKIFFPYYKLTDIPIEPGKYYSFKAYCTKKEELFIISATHIPLDTAL